jgi:hypothetical protein
MIRSSVNRLFRIDPPADFGDADHAVRLKSISQFGRRRSPGSDEGDH